jgi:tetratricopeptide (TPR) repeat protein
MSNKLHSQQFTTSAIARLEILREQQRQQDLSKQKQAIERKRVIEIKEQQKNREANQKLQKKQQAQKQLEFDTLYYSTASMLKDNQLSSAKSNLDKLNKMMPGNEKLALLNKEFSEKLPGHVEALLNRGRQLYINGKIEKARDIWLKAQKLDPKNKEIIKNIERANRVLGRLDELKKKGAQ